MAKPKHKTWSGQDHSKFYPNLPKYQIGEHTNDFYCDRCGRENCQLITRIEDKLDNFGKTRRYYSTCQSCYWESLSLVDWYERKNLKSKKIDD